MKRECLYLPYDYPITPEIIRLKDGGAVTSFKATGIDIAMMGAQAIAALHELRSLAYQSLRGDGWTMHQTIIRRVETQLMASTPAAPQLAAIDQRAKQSMIDDGLFVNDIYVSLIRHAGLSATSKSRFYMQRKKDRAAQIEDWSSDLEQFAGRFQALMRPFGLTQLGCTQRTDSTWINDQASLYGQIINGGHYQPMRLSDHIDEYISVRRKDFKGNIWAAGDVGPNTWGSMMTIEYYAGTTRPNVLDAICSLPLPLIVSQSFSADDTDETNSAIDWQDHRLNSIHGDSAEDLIAQLIRDKKQIATGDVNYGLHHLSVTPLIQQTGSAEDASRAVTRACNDITAAFAGAGITVKRESTNAMAMFYAMAPGALHDAGPRRRRINTRNWASYAAFNSDHSGALSGHHWGDATAVFPTLKRTRKAFSFHSGDVGHFAALGKTGEGKTALINYLLLMSARHADAPRVVLLDKDNSGEVAFRYAGGVYQDITIGEETGYNFLYFADNESRIVAAAEFLMQLLIITDCIDSSDNRDRVTRAVKQACSMGEDHRNIDEVAGFLANTGEGSPGHAIAPWCKGGRYHWVFGAKVDTFATDANYIGINLGEIIEHPQLGEPVTMYLINRVQSMINGDPLILFVEEAHATIKKPLFLEKFVYFEKTMRKYNGVIGFGTQDAPDLANSPAAHQLISNLATLICAPHPDAAPESYNGFQLNPQHVAAICGLAQGSRHYFIKTGSDAAVIDGDLSGLGDFIEVLSSNPRKVELCANVRAQYGEDPAVWGPHFFEELRNEKDAIRNRDIADIDGLSDTGRIEEKPLRLLQSNG